MECKSNLSLLSCYIQYTEIEFFNLNLNTSKINCSFVFTDEIIDLILETTFELNKKENLGVRRLKSIFQMLAGEKAFLIDYDKTIVIDRSDIENVRDAILKTSSTKLNQIHGNTPSRLVHYAYAGSNPASSTIS